MAGFSWFQSGSGYDMFLSVCLSGRVRPLSDGSNPWSTSLMKTQKSVPLAALFVEQGESSQNNNNNNNNNNDNHTYKDGTYLIK